MRLRLLRRRRTIWRRGLRGLRIVLHFVAKGDLGFRAKLLIVLIADGLANALVAALEMQRIVCDGIGWEPVFPVDLFAVGLKLGELIIALAAGIADAAPVGLDNLQIPIVHPHFAREVA